jgi:hypothetical protein
MADEWVAAAAALFGVLRYQAAEFAPLIFLQHHIEGFPCKFTRMAFGALHVRQQPSPARRRC